MDQDAELAAAIAAHRARRIDEAQAGYVRVLTANPDQPDALHFLGVLRHQRGDTARALEFIRRALELAPDNAAAHNNLGNVLRATGNDQAALKSYAAAIGIDPSLPDPYCNAGVIFRNAGRIDDAMAALIRAIELNPDHAEAQHNLGFCHLLAGDLRVAADHFEAALQVAWGGWLNPVWYARVLSALGRTERTVELLEAHLAANPDDPVALHHLAAVKGQDLARASDGYVKKHFDDFAASFDAVLGRLRYNGHTAVGALVNARHAPGAALDVADLGCGTGLCGAMLRPIAARLTGIDLSPGMLREAAKRQLYDYLVEGELTAFLLQADPGSFDLCVCADTLCYFGDLSPVLQALAPTLRPGGALIATIEWMEAGETRLNDTGRYSHSLEHLHAAARAAGLGIGTGETLVLRHELSEPVMGHVFVLERAT